MKIWAIADLHLSFGVPNKKMDIFGEAWREHASQIEAYWKESVGEEDLVLIAGDISWAMRLDEVIPDLRWVETLPGTKLLLKGNHDYWWGSLNKIKAILPPSLHLIQNGAFHWKDRVTIGGARLWDSSEYHFPLHQDQEEKEKETKEEVIQAELQEKIFERELQRLELSLSQLSSAGHLRLAMTHYPPIGADLKPSRASAILEKYRIDTCVFGHLHGFTPGTLPFGEKRGVRYILSACDYLKFQPLLVYDLG